MTTTFEDLAKLGIVDKPIEEPPAELIEFLQHHGVVPPEDPSDQYLADINALMEHGGYIAQYGVLGMKWGVRKDRNGLYNITTDPSDRTHSSYRAANQLSPSSTREIFRKAQVEVKKELDKLNATTDYANPDVPKNKWSKVDYSNQAAEAIIRGFETATKKEARRRNITAAITVSVSLLFATAMLSIRSGGLLIHAAEPEETDDLVLNLNLIRDDAGRIIDIEFPEETLAHYGVLGMRWGRRKDRSGKYHNTPNRMAGNHPGQGNVMEVSGVVKKEFGRPKVGGPIKTHEGRGTITEVTERKDGTFFVKVDVPDPGKVKGGNKTTAPEQPKSDRPAQPAQPSNQTDSPSTDSTPKPQGSQKSEFERRNDELAAIIRRIELEQKYAKLTAVPKPKLQEATEKILAEAAKKTATDAATKAMGALVIMATAKAAKTLAEQKQKKS